MARISVNIDQVVKGLDERKQNSKKVLERTLGDFKSLGPGWISKGVREEYNIKKGDVKSTLHATGSGLHDMAIISKGRVLTPTHFNMSPKSRPGGNKKYQVKATIKKGQRKTLSSKAFLAGNGGGGQIPFQRTGADRLPIEAIKTLSVPQMIEDGNGNMKQGVQKEVNENLEKRFRHHCDHLLK